MRIIGGKFRGRPLRQPKFKPTRPTTDIAKEGLFNILSNRFSFDKVSFLDLFSGTGSISYEFASRGCQDITSVERHRPCLNFIKQTSQTLGIPNHKIFAMDVFKYIERCETSYDLIFAGPPYGMPRLDIIPDVIITQNMINDIGYLILEHNPNHDFTHHPHFLESRNYGQTIFAIFTKEEVQK